MYNENFPTIDIWDTGEFPEIYCSLEGFAKSFISPGKIYPNMWV